MRIGILASVSRRLPHRHYGGWEAMAHLLAEGLSAKEHDVTLFATADSHTSARLESVVPRPLEEDRDLPSRVFETLHITHAYEQAARLDILHNNIGVFGAVLSRLSAVPVLTTLHGSAAEEDSRIAYLRYREQPYVSISDAERALAPELNYVATVFNGIPTDGLPEPTDPDDYLLFVGRLSPDKGAHNAVHVAQVTGRRLLISGIVPQSDQAYYETKIAPYVDGKRITFLGPCDPDTRNNLMNRAYAFLHLIEYREAFGLTTAEAMATGCPVIAYRRGSVPEVVRDGETGYIVDTIEEAINAVDRVPSLDRRTCSQWAQERFSAAQMVDGYERVYEALALAS